MENNDKSLGRPLLVEIDGLCKLLSIGKNTAYKLLTEGKIESFKIGSVWKIPTQSILDYIDKCAEEQAEKSKVPEELVNKKPISTPEPKPETKEEKPKKLMYRIVGDGKIRDLKIK
mgnify:CR=1 FL=1